MSERDSIGRRKRPPKPKPVATCECGDHCWSPATRGHVVLVSPEDAHLLRRQSWCAAERCATAYAQSRWKKKALYLHRLILSGAAEIDHQNRNGMDNRRSNLRSCTREQNSANTRKRRNSQSPYKGVWRMYRKWSAIIGSGSNRTYLGLYESPEAARDAYMREARLRYGEFASE